MRFTTYRAAESYRVCRHTTEYASNLKTVKYYCPVNKRHFWTVVYRPSN